jgi:hypothetical protein
MILNFGNEAEPMSRSHRDPPADECRCPCGSLLARLRSDGIELKCRRCKRILMVPWSAVEGHEAISGGSWPAPA